MRILSVVLVSLLFILSSFSPPAKGVDYTSTKGKVSATFPSEYTITDKEEEGYQTTQVIGTLDDQSYMVSYTTHETELSGDIDLEQVSLEAFAEAIAADIKSQEKWKSNNGIEGIKASMYSEESAAIIEYIILFNGNVQYQFAVYAVAESYDEKKANSFFKTIKLQ